MNDGVEPRLGVSVAEALVALLLGLWVLQASVALLAVHRSVVEQMTRRSEVLTALWTGRRVLDAELRRGIRGRDWWVGSGDSVALRAFRATAVVCAAAPATELAVAVRGSRAANPAKDSVLILTRDGRWEARAVTAAAPSSACAGAAWGEGRRWSLSDSVSGAPVLARLFERGSYHVRDGALRYRRGRAGRQPLTPGVLGSSSGLEARERGALLRLLPEAARGILSGGWVGPVGGEP